MAEEAQPRTALEGHRESVASPRGYSLSVINLPIPENPKAVIIFLHGYGDYCDHNGICPEISQRGYAVCTFDQYGHGKSDGLFGLVPSFTNMVDDAAFVLQRFVDSDDKLKGLPRYVLGESMGGAISLEVSLQHPDAVDGVILVAPMCKIADEMMPPKPVVWALRGLSRIFPNAQVVPGPEIVSKCNKIQSVTDEALANPLTYAPRKPRVKTAVTLLDATLQLEPRLKDVSKPILIMHGAADVVTDPKHSELLYESAVSEDKTLEMFEGMWHGLWFEPEGGREKVLNTMFTWLDKRTNQ